MMHRSVTGLCQGGGIDCSVAAMKEVFKCVLGLFGVLFFLLLLS